MRLASPWSACAHDPAMMARRLPRGPYGANARDRRETDRLVRFSHHRFACFVGAVYATRARSLFIRANAAECGRMRANAAECGPNSARTAAGRGSASARPVLNCRKRAAIGQKGRDHRIAMQLELILYSLILRAGIGPVQS